MQVKDFTEAIGAEIGNIKDKRLGEVSHSYLMDENF